MFITLRTAECERHTLCATCSAWIKVRIMRCLSGWSPGCALAECRCGQEENGHQYASRHWPSLAYRGGLAQTSLFEVCDLPKGGSSGRMSTTPAQDTPPLHMDAELPAHKRCLRQIADLKQRGLRHPAAAARQRRYSFSASGFAYRVRSISRLAPSAAIASNSSLERFIGGTFPTKKYKLNSTSWL